MWQGLEAKIGRQPLYFLTILAHSGSDHTDHGHNDTATDAAARQLAYDRTNVQSSSTAHRTHHLRRAQHTPLSAPKTAAHNT